MMKTSHTATGILTMVLLAISLNMRAQGTWQVPGKVAVPDEKKKEKVEKKSEKMEIITPLPLVEGKVVFQYTDTLQGISASTLYERAYKWLETATKEEGQLDSRIALVNTDSHQIIGKFSEWLYFSRALLAVDRARFSYVIQIDCGDEIVHLTISRLFYHYDEDRPTRIDASAEEWITDEKALNKTRQKYIKGRRKFRETTIRRINEFHDRLLVALLKSE